MKEKRYATIVIVFVAILLTTACTGGSPEQSDPVDSLEPVADMANPAAVYCAGLGYALENVTRNGGGDADCIFPDESRCSQWDFLSGRCGQQYSYCELQGYELLEGTNIGNCQFTDGSTCDEYQFYSSVCGPGDYPAEVEEEPIQILGFSEARDFLTAYFADQYSIQVPEPWLEQNITPEDAQGVSTFRFVSGPVTIVITAPAGVPGPSEYTIKEASNITNGFYWEGTLSNTGEITETRVFRPGTILNEENARDAVLEHMITTYNLPSFGEWTDMGISQTDADTVLRVFTSESWVAEVEFAPAAPLVSNYQVTVDNLSEGIRWEGEITLRGVITESSFKR